MKKVVLAIVMVLGFSSAQAAENWFVVASSILGQSTVVEVYGWEDNKTPCISLAKAMNVMIEADGYNPIDKSFTCVPQNIADELDRDNPLSMRVVE
jgi:hypothetical protein